MGRVKWILDGPRDLCKAFADGHIPEDATELILKKAKSPAHLAQLGAYVAAWNQLDAGGQLTLEEIEEHLGLAEEQPQPQQLGLLSSPMTAAKPTLAFPVRHEHNIVAAIDQQCRALVDLLDEARSEGIPIPDLDACFDLIAEFRQRLEQ